VFSFALQAIWTERNPAVTCVVWRPDGLVFGVGHEDGCISIWSLEEPDKPLMVRTLTKEDVNITDAESLFDAGALDGHTAGASSVVREPIFKLVWASFPDRTALSALIAAQGTDTGVEPVQSSTVQYTDKEETLLVVLGGCLSDEPPAINVLQMPAYAPPPVIKAIVASPTEGLPLAVRKAYRESFSVTGMTKYPTAAPAEDFVLVPRTSPFFNLSHDPIAIVIFLTPDERLPLIKGPHGQRGVDAWSFPPPRSDLPPDDTGRKNFHTTTDEALQGAVMSAVPTLHSPGLLTSDSNGSWRFPWSSSPASPGLSAFASGAMARNVKPPRPLRLPSIFWTGGTNVLGCEIFSLDTVTFRKLIAYSIEIAGHEEKPRIPLSGGTAVPDLYSVNAAEVGLTKMENYRILATWHADGAVR
jgi:syntaxin-binding protein 5